MIRPATERDFDRMMELGRAFNIEAGYEAVSGFDPPSFKRTLEVLAKAGLLLAAEVDGEVIGMAGADVSGAVCNYSFKVGREQFWYIAPEHRNPAAGAGRKLLSALELAAKNYGAVMFDAVAENGKRDEPLARLYRAAGYSPAERVFRKVL